jgi:hypothetical protein
VAAFRANTFFYEVNGDNTLPFTPVVGATANENVTTHALLCMLDINMAADPVVQGCVAPGGEDNPDYFVLTLMARGQADCDNNGANCTAEALVSEKIGSYGPAGGEGGMPAPLTSKNTLPEGASTDIVPNPNGGGVGVPMSVWIDGNQAVVDGWTGSWATCEAHEWYEVDMFPDDFRCPDPSRVCTCDGKKQISYSLPGSTEQFLGIDVVEDPAFPPNLMSYLFPTTNDEDGADYVKSIADDVVTDCSGLGPGSYGLIVVEENCSITGGGLIGTAAAPVFLVLLGADNSFGGGVEIFGTLFQSTAIHANGGISGNGNLTIYGAMMNDGDISKFSGNLKLVYVDEILDRAFEIGEFASVPGGWTDFHPVWQ